MRARTILVPTAIGCVGLAVWSAWWLFAGDAQEDGARAARPSVRSDRAPVRLEDSEESQSGGPGDVAGSGLEFERPTRSSEIVFTDTDTLRAVRGFVLDARTREPVAGIGLTFLSRRPRTTTVVTDPLGGFQTGQELAAGLVNVLHAPDAADARFSARFELEPSQFVLPPRDPSRPANDVLELYILAREPERVLDVEIRMPDGAPAHGAAVAVTWGQRDEEGEFVGVRRDFEETDAHGRVRFPFVDTVGLAHALRVEAEHGGTLASEVLALDPPIAPRPLALALHPGGVVRVRCVNDEGRPLAGVSTYLALQEDARAARGWHGVSDAAGESHYAALRAGCYAVSALHPLSGQRVERVVDLARGEHESTELVLGLSGLRPAMAGLVLDEYGYPLPGAELAITHPSGESVSLVSGDKGQFEYWSKPDSEFLVSIGGGVADDRFEPSETVVAFGTRGIVLRRAQVVPERTLAFEIVDRDTRELLRSARVALHLGELERATPRAIERLAAPGGVAQGTFRLRPELGFVVEAPGHVRATGRVADLFRRDPSRLVARIELARGFERMLVVRERGSGRPLPGVRVSLGERELGRTGADGRVELILESWPAELRFESAGRVTLAWDPLTAPFPGDDVWLDSLR